MADTQAKIKRMKRTRILWTVILAVVVVVVLGFIILFRVFTLQKLDITGCTLYPSSAVEKEIKSEKRSWNSLFVYMKYRNGKMDALPYIDSVSVSMVTPHELKFRVKEKEVLGYIYDSSLKKYVYFDPDGTALRISGKALSNEVRIRGLTAKNIALYEKMNFTNHGVLQTLESLTALLKSYNRIPESVTVRSGNTFWLDYGDIQVNLGTGMYLNEKVARMVKILPKLKNKKGVLHVETWTETTTDIYFRSGETMSSSSSSGSSDSSDTSSSSSDSSGSTSGDGSSESGSSGSSDSSSASSGTTDSSSTSGDSSSDSGDSSSSGSGSDSGDSSSSNSGSQSGSSNDSSSSDSGSTGTNGSDTGNNGTDTQ